jgi:hypothetical protein
LSGAVDRRSLLNITTKQTADSRQTRPEGGIYFKFEGYGRRKSEADSVLYLVIYLVKRRKSKPKKRTSFLFSSSSRATSQLFWISLVTRGANALPIAELDLAITKRRSSLLKLSCSLSCIFSGRCRIVQPMSDNALSIKKAGSNEDAGTPISWQRRR